MIEVKIERVPALEGVVDRFAAVAGSVRCRGWILSFPGRIQPLDPIRIDSIKPANAGTPIRFINGANRTCILESTAALNPADWKDAPIEFNDAGIDDHTVTQFFRLKLD